ncbi:serine hydrolase [Leptolyngbya sp. GGD]|uniref:serine hydrolase n=1 Tax=Leptolyngbya sp. GGD TaxID=2997907 RepID=UPI00227D261D|nr:serine hydrolase [Leptolyngbya sp. GGD]MCY6494260.1 serine hydrolase [Leptolyngbya sp. GGD]
MTNRILKSRFEQLKLAQYAVMLLIPSVIVPLVYFSDIGGRNQVEQQPINNNRANSSQVKSNIAMAKQPVVRSTPLQLPLVASAKPPIQLAYNVAGTPALMTSTRLQAIVNNAVKTAESKGLPIEPLSISLISLRDTRCSLYAGFQDRQPRFPASISKLFWMVALLGQMRQNVVPETAITDRQLYKMINKSDNEIASIVVDTLTDAESGEVLPKDEFAVWLEKRKSLNRFFEAAGYQSINISQKNFPIPYLKLQEPRGRDLQMRGDLQNPVRNSLTTYETARLTYEIHSNQAISPQDSDRMERMMQRDLRPEVWKKEQYNSIEGFLGELLPLDTYFASKVGWTSSSRQDTAIIRSSDGTAHYILTVFGDHKAYADDWEIFPKLSRQIFDQFREQPVICSSIS